MRPQGAATVNGQDYVLTPWTCSQGTYWTLEILRFCSGSVGAFEGRGMSAEVNYPRLITGIATSMPASEAVAKFKQIIKDSVVLVVGRGDWNDAWFDDLRVDHMVSLIEAILRYQYAEALPELKKKMAQLLGLSLPATDTTA